jgi:hypothetical protein
MWRAYNSHQLRHADRAEPGQFDQDPIVGVGSRLRQEPLFGLLAQLRERFQLLEQRFSSKARGLLAEFGQPVRALIRSIEIASWAGDSTSAIDRLQPILDPGRVFNQIVIGATDFL